MLTNDLYHLSVHQLANLSMYLISVYPCIIYLSIYLHHHPPPHHHIRVCVSVFVNGSYAYLISEETKEVIKSHKAGITGSF